jgi:hypothetical protein
MQIIPLGAPMEEQPADASISLNGKMVRVPSLTVGPHTIIVIGRWLRIATINDEEWLDGQGAGDPETFIHKLKTGPVRGDIFSFGQGLQPIARKLPYYFELDNLAALPTQSHLAWWNKLSQETRRNVRLAGKRGVVVSVVPFNDELVHGIMGIYNESPYRQGRKFWHFGKDFAAVKRENGTFLDRSEFIGAYLGSELIGFMKIVRVNSTASIMQILSKNTCQDKKPMNALISKAVELCEQKNWSQLIYRKFTYNQNVDDPLTEFKRRNGFNEMLVPRYFVPLTSRGALALKLKLHHGARELIPHPLKVILRNLRRAWIDCKSSAAAGAHR